MTKILRSVRFNIFLGALIALASAAGTLLPQISESPERAAQYQAAHPQWSKLFSFFNLFDLYHSWWFMALLALMAVDIVLCKLWNAPPDVGIVSLPPEATREKEAEKHLAQKESALKLKPYQASFVSGIPFAEAAETARGRLRAAGYHVHDDFAVAAGAAFVATKHRVQRWGSYVAHIALVTILVGSLIKAVWGFVEMVPVLEGRSRAMQNKPDWEVYVDKFEIAYYAGTRNPKSFSSALRVNQGERQLAAKTIYVNDPLDIGGVRFYQASWGAGGMFRSVTLKIGQKLLQMPQRSKAKIPGTPFLVEADVMMPNFTINEGAADTASLDLKNPAVRFIFHMGPHKTRPLWLFESDPSLCFVEDENGLLSRAPRPPFHLVAVDPVLFSGIQVAYDPGYGVVVAGSLMWLFGTVALFYLHRRRLWILLEPAAEGARVSVGGWSSRGPQEYENEFAGLMASLRDSMSPQAGFQLSREPFAALGEKS